jgi:hypothetical protein
VRIMSMELAIRQLLDGESICAGAQPGRALLQALLSEVAAQPARPEPLLLDFTNIEVATASFLRESVLALKSLLRAQKSRLYPIIANANAQVRDELEILLFASDEALIACDLESGGNTTNLHLIGRIDEKQRRIFDLVQAEGETDAGDLHKRFGETERVQQTAWNNRLSALASAGLVIETSHGRAKRYQSVLKGV